MKKRKKKYLEEDDGGLEPEGMWVSPTGEYIIVVEHLLAISSEPERFDLPQSLLGERDVETLRAAAVSLIKNGWTRFRYLVGVYAFEVDNAARRMSVIEKVLADVKAYTAESVSISEFDPRREYEGTVEDVFDRRITRFAANPGKNTWRFS